MPRYIDADELLARYKERCAGCKETKNYCEHCCDIADVISDIEDAPTLDVVERKKGIWTTHEVACLLAEVVGDECACNVNGNDEWLPFVCEFAETTCPNVVGVTCWEQWLVHRKEKTDETN